MISIPDSELDEDAIFNWKMPKRFSITRSIDKRSTNSGTSSEFQKLEQGKG